MKRLSLAWFGVFAAALVTSGLGCELITAPDRSKIGTGGTGGDTTTVSIGGGGVGGTAGSGGTTGGTGGTGGTTGGTAGTGGMMCETPDQCPDPENECVVRTCVDMFCDTDVVAEGTASPNQTAGDCKHAECNGQGTLEAVDDNLDLPDDDNECTDDTCVAGAKTFTNKAAGEACTVGGSLCNGSGECVECLIADDCPGADTECAVRTCSATGVCGVDNAAQGAPVASQIVGNCKKDQCDGNGAVETVNDNLDVEDDGNECTDNSCNMGVPVAAPTAINTACGVGGLLKCDGGAGGTTVGLCVGCTEVSQCATPGNTCLVATCVAGSCGTANQTNGTACSDGDSCSQTDTCQAGACTGANPVVCTASDQCHDVGTCAPATGLCSDPNKANGTTCSDGNGCTQTDTCQAGACTGASPVVCPMPDQCHDAGMCNPATGVCSNPAKANGVTCSDGDSCSQTDTCQAGTCTGASPVVCPTPDQCHDAGVCNPATGVCSNPNKMNGATCNDSNGCTQADTCQAGTCTGANPVVCPMPDQCHDAGMCNPATGVCSNPNKTDGATCNDGSLCTGTDTCQAGTCTGASPVVCTASDQCHDVGTCAPATGLCSNPNKANGTTCNDGSLCTGTDTCQAGTCTGASPVVCTASDQCHDVGTCAPATGVCSNPNKTDGATCNDGDGCTQTDTCQTGTCTGASPVVCTASDACHVAGTCAPATGLCSNPNAPDGTMCAGGLCSAGSCVLASCGDLAKNGNETDIDCGGPDCSPCANTKVCAAGTDCTSGNCVGNVCVECVSAATCPGGADTECHIKTCINNTCGINDPVMGTVTVAQTDDDCKENQCDGAGNIVVVNQDADLPAADTTQCTTETCTAGVPSSPPTGVGTACNDNGGSVCNGAGACVVPPSVTATTPADSATGVVSPSAVSVTFSGTMSAATLTAQTVAGACSGSIQLSADSFATCLAFTTAAPTISGTTATLIPAPGFAVGRTHKVRVTTAATNAAGVALASAFTQATGFTTETVPASCAATSVIISQAYGGGGAAAGTYKSDFVELYNAGAVAVNLNTWAINYASSQGTTWTKSNLSGTIQPGSYFLVKLAGNAGLLDLPTPDLSTATISAAGTAGKFVLTNTTTAVTGACPSGANVADIVGYGTGTDCFEGTGPTAPTAATTSAVRKGFGCTETNSNAADFSVAQVNPRNSTFRRPLNETGATGEADFCVLFSPATISVPTATTSGTILGRLYEAGVTEAAGASATVTAQVGYGPTTTNPQVSLGWTWSAATFTQQTGPFGNDDEYGGSFTAPAAGSYNYGFRVSLDAGASWTYCDLDKSPTGDTGAGSLSNLAYQPEAAGLLTVTGP